MENPFTILVVDDDRAILNIFEFGLQEQGYEVHTATTAAAALKVFKTLRIDCLLCDIKLPDMDGVTLTGTLQERYPELVTIVMTGYPGIKSAIQGLRENVQDYLIKPFSVDQVVTSIERARQIRQLEQDNLLGQARIRELETANEALRLQLEEYRVEQADVQQGVLGARKRMGGGPGERARQSYAQQSVNQPVREEPQDIEQLETGDEDS